MKEMRGPQRVMGTTNSGKDVALTNISRETNSFHDFVQYPE